MFIALWYTLGVNAAGYVAAQGLGNPGLAWLVRPCYLVAVRLKDIVSVQVITHGFMRICSACVLALDLLRRVHL